MDAPLHADVWRLAFLLGRWEGGGEGVWPPGEPFRYGEEMTFGHVGDAFLLYGQRSWSPDDGAPIHFERGFLRPASGDRVEMVLAHPLGVAEVSEGTLSDRGIDVIATQLARSSTGSPVTALRRRIEVDHDEMRYELWMGTNGSDPTRHLVGELVRARD